MFARGERRWYVRAQTWITLKYYNAVSDVTVDNRLWVDIAAFNRTDSHRNILKFGHILQNTLYKANFSVWGQDRPTFGNAIYL
jgi:hypothetical protein